MNIEFNTSVTNFALDNSIYSSNDESPKTKTVSPDPQTHKELEKLNKQVERYKDIVQQQEKLIQVSAIYCLI